MADVYLDPGRVEDAEGQLTQAHREMMDSIDGTVTALGAAHGHLDGATNDAWGEFQKTANEQTGALNSDFGAGINALRQMREILVDADNAGAKRFG